MRTVWIILGVLFALGALCCGGVLFMGRGIITSIAKTNDEADRFAAEVVLEVGKDWNPATLNRYAAPELKEEISQEQLALILKGYAQQLGKIHSCDDFTAYSIKSNSLNGETVTSVRAKAYATFEKGSGEVYVRIVKHAGKWGIARLEVRPSKSDETPRSEEI